MKKLILALSIGIVAALGFTGTASAANCTPSVVSGPGVTSRTNFVTYKLSCTNASKVKFVVGYIQYQANGQYFAMQEGTGIRNTPLDIHAHSEATQTITYCDHCRGAGYPPSLICWEFGMPSPGFLKGGLTFAIYNAVTGTWGQNTYWEQSGWTYNYC